MNDATHSAIILAGGKGLRLRPLTEDRPKLMVDLCNRPMVEWQVDWLTRYGFSNITFAAGYCWENIKNHFGDGSSRGLRVNYSVEDEPIGTGGALREALRYVDEDSCVVVNGDVLTDMNLREMMEQHLQRGTKATVLVVPFTSPYGVVDITPEGTVRRFEEKPVFHDVWVNGGVYAVSSDIVDQLPARGDIETATFPNLAEQGLIAAYQYGGFWRTVDTIKDLQLLETELQARWPPSNL